MIKQNNFSRKNQVNKLSQFFPHQVRCYIPNTYIYMHIKAYPLIKKNGINPHHHSTENQHNVSVHVVHAVDKAIHDN